MPQSTVDIVKAWTAPALLAVVLALSGILWSNSQSRISALESSLAASQNTLAVIQANQEDRKAVSDLFYLQTSKRLDAMSDILSKLGDAVVRLTTIQEQSAKR